MPGPNLPFGENPAPPTDQQNSNTANPYPTQPFGVVPSVGQSPLNPNTSDGFGVLQGLIPGDLTTNKSALGSVFPEHAVAGQGVSRIEAIISPEQLRSRFLFGIPLFSNQKNPLTGVRDQITDEMLRDDFITRGINLAEELCHIDIVPVQRFEKYPFDKAFYEAFGYMLTEHKPVNSVQQLAIVPSNNIVVYVVPPQWIEGSGFPRGQINIVPLTAAFEGSGFLPPSSSAGGAAFLQILGTKNFIPYYWQLNYVTGFPNGAVPVMINELIGSISAKLVLENLAASNKVGQYSQSIDGFSQNVNVIGPQVYDTRLTQLEERIQQLVGKIKSRFSVKMSMTTI
jgi:hypothetical protein